MPRERGELWVSSYAQWALAFTRLVTGRAEEALQSAREGLRIKRHFHDTLGTLLALETCARIFVMRDELTLAAKLLGALHQNWRSAGLPQMGAPFLTDDHNVCVRDCVRRMGELAYKNAFEDGARLDLDEASELALEGEPDASD
ncbi:hypothetical protein AB0392_49005 [Nonomuraea angiospora]|uniref:hypothetical protein n=1 Tax=Nonomuraea angiospora TaxID=46172 RepID=UPI00344DD575